MRFAKLKNNIVENIISANEEFANGRDDLIQSDTAKIGDVWNGAEFVTPEEIVDIEDARREKLQALKDEYQKRIDDAYAAYPEFEKETFPIQKAEWTSFVQDANAPTPFVDALASSRGATKEGMMAKIGRASVAIATIQGDLQKRRAAVETATTIEEIEQA